MQVRWAATVLTIINTLWLFHNVTVYQNIQLFTFSICTQFLFVSYTSIKLGEKGKYNFLLAVLCMSMISTGHNVSGCLSIQVRQNWWELLVNWKFVIHRILMVCKDWVRCPFVSFTRGCNTLVIMECFLSNKILNTDVNHLFFFSLKSFWAQQAAAHTYSGFRSRISRCETQGPRFLALDMSWSPSFPHLMGLVTCAWVVPDSGCCLL